MQLTAPLTERARMDVSDNNISYYVDFIMSFNSITSKILLTDNAGSFCLFKRFNNMKTSEYGEEKIGTEVKTSRSRFYLNSEGIEKRTFSNVENSLCNVHSFKI